MAAEGRDEAHHGRCGFPPGRVAPYRARISGPLLDRIDLHVEVPRVPAEAIASSTASESSAEVAARVEAAQSRQHARQGCINARLEASALDRHVAATPAALALLGRATQRLALSARAWHRVLRVARTIADLAGLERVDVAHVAEAVSLRQLDRRAGEVNSTSAR